MTIEEFKKRCNDEFKAKEKGKWIASIVFMVLGALVAVYTLISIIIALASGDAVRFASVALGITASSFVPASGQLKLLTAAESASYDFTIYVVLILLILLLFGISLALTYERDKVIRKYKKSGEYQNLPVDYPYSLLYPGETWPFGQTNIQPQNNSINSAPIKPVPTPVASAPAPESIGITCEKCGQQMLIPSGSGTVRLTCPKCGSDIIHTYSN